MCCVLLISGAGAVSQCRGLGWATPGYFLLVLDCGEPADGLANNSWYSLALALSWDGACSNLGTDILIYFRNRYA